MAERPGGYGLTAEVREKISGKYSVELAKDAIDWIRLFVPSTPEIDCSDETDVHAKLQDGKILCTLINALQPGSVKRINESKMAFKQMENIGNFLTAIGNYGVLKNDTFQTVDLYEGQNIPSVISTIHALGRKAQGCGQKGIGPKESEKNVREFTEDQLRSGQSVIGLQMGSNKGATQSGQNFGKGRQIMD